MADDSPARTLHWHRRLRRHRLRQNHLLHIPLRNQILAFRSTDTERRAGGLVLEVKGDFCHKVREILSSHGREGDYLEVALHSRTTYLPNGGDAAAGWVSSVITRFTTTWKPTPWLWHRQPAE